MDVDITAEPPSREAPPSPHPQTVREGKDPRLRRRYLIAGAFLLPAAIFLLVWIVYPTIYTIVRSFFDRSGESFVGFSNYGEIFTTDILLTAIRNNAVWVAAVPLTVTAIGLVFAVLTERIRWSVAFKTVIFMPMAISLFAAGVIWRIMYEQDPSRGTINAAIAGIQDAFTSSGVLERAIPSTADLQGSIDSGFELQEDLRPGDTALLGLSGIPAAAVEGAPAAAEPKARDGGITGVVWRDFSPGGGHPGEIEKGEVALPGVTVALRTAGGDVVAETQTDDHGRFVFEDVGRGAFRVAIAAETFSAPFDGVPWLGPKLVTPAVMIAYIWVWAGFAMVVIAAGLAAIPRDVLEAARTDGATEWQVFRRVTVPLLAPTLSVVFITMMINVLKVFDIILSVAPASTQDDANVIALAMWRTSFGGVNDFGVGSAIAVFLFVLVVPVLILNVRRFKMEAY